MADTTRKSAAECCAEGMHGERPTVSSAEIAAHETWSSSLPLRELVTYHGSPLYIINEKTLDENYNVLSGASTRFGELDPNGRGYSDSCISQCGNSLCITYPVKANYSRFILQYLARRGAQADCASAVEVRWALDAGFSIDRIVYNTPAPEREYLVELLCVGATIVLDSLELLSYVSTRMRSITGRCDSNGPPEQSACGRILLRVNPQNIPGYQRQSPWEHLISHGGMQSKFGIAEEEIDEGNLGGSIPIDGLHIHVGTQMDHVEGWASSIRVLHRIAERVRLVQQKPLTVLNLGGGLAIPFVVSDEYPNRSAYIGAVLQEARPEYTYWIEPGHALVGDAVGLATTVRELKVIRGKRWGICDVGTDQLSRITLAGWRHRIIREGGGALADTGPDSLGGPLCFAGDVLLPETDLSGVERGEVVLVQHVGAYCASASSQFNGRLAPGEVVIRSDGSIQRTNDVEGTCLGAAQLSSLNAQLEEFRWRPMAVSSGDLIDGGAQLGGGARLGGAEGSLVAGVIPQFHATEPNELVTVEGVHGFERWIVLTAESAGRYRRFVVGQPGDEATRLTIGKAVDLLERLIGVLLIHEGLLGRGNEAFGEGPLVHVSGDKNGGVAEFGATWAIEHGGGDRFVSDVQVVLDIGDEEVGGMVGIHQRRIRFDICDGWLLGTVNIGHRRLATP